MSHLSHAAASAAAKVASATTLIASKAVSESVTFEAMGDLVTSLRQLARVDALNVSDGACCARSRQIVAGILKSSYFDRVMGAVILMNSVAIGVGFSAKLEGWSAEARWRLAVLEQTFLCIYLVEFSMRIFVMSTRFVEDSWVVFDGAVVVACILSEWVCAAFVPDSGSLGPLVVVRIMRCFRLARTLRIIVKVRGLWLLVRSFLDSFAATAHFMLLLVIVLYMFALVGVDLITFSSANMGPEPDPDFQKVAEEHFPSLGVAMMTLVQFTFMDGIAEIYKPLIMHDPTPPLLAIYFTGAIVVIGIVLMNLITSIVVSTALNNAEKDKEAKRISEDNERRYLAKTLQKMFYRIDQDGSGKVSLQELQHASEEDQAALRNALDLVDVTSLFESLDADGSGNLSTDEFCDGIWQLSMRQVPFEIKRAEIKFQRMGTQKFLEQRVQLTNLDQRLAVLQEGLTEALLMLRPGTTVLHALRAETTHPAHAPCEGESEAGSPLADSSPPAPPCLAAGWEDLSLRIEHAVALSVRRELSAACCHQFAKPAPAVLSAVQPPPVAGTLPNFASIHSTFDTVTGLSSALRRAVEKLEGALSDALCCMDGALPLDGVSPTRFAAWTDFPKALRPDRAYLHTVDCLPEWGADADLGPHSQLVAPTSLTL